MTQLGLLDLEHRLLYQEGSPTSLDAARNVAADLPRITSLVLAYIVSRGEAGSTYRECMEATGFCGGTVTARFNELKAAGLAVATVQRRNGCGVVVAAPFFGSTCGVSETRRNTE